MLAGIVPGLSGIVGVASLLSSLDLTAWPGALRDSAADAGWDVRECGTDDLAGALGEDTEWDAVLPQYPVPQSAADPCALWGSDVSASLTGGGDQECPWAGETATLASGAVEWSIPDR